MDHALLAPESLNICKRRWFFQQVVIVSINLFRLLLFFKLNIHKRFKVISIVHFHQHHCFSWSCILHSWNNKLFSEYFSFVNLAWTTVEGTLFIGLLNNGIFLFRIFIKFWSEILLNLNFLLLLFLIFKIYFDVSFKESTEVIF